MGVEISAIEAGELGGDQRHPRIERFGAIFCPHDELRMVLRGAIAVAAESPRDGCEELVLCAFEERRRRPDELRRLVQRRFHRLLVGFVDPLFNRSDPGPTGGHDHQGVVEVLLLQPFTQRRRYAAQ